MARACTLNGALVAFDQAVVDTAVFLAPPRRASAGGRRGGGVQGLAGGERRSRVLLQLAKVRLRKVTALRFESRGREALARGRCDAAVGWRS